MTDQHAVLACRIAAAALALTTYHTATHGHLAWAVTCAYLAAVLALIAAGIVWQTSRAACCQYGRHSNGAAHSAACTRKDTSA